MELVQNIQSIACDGEILSSKPLDTFSLLAERQAHYGDLNFGFKVKTAHLHNPYEFLDKLHEDGWKFIHLIRLNILNTCLSYFYARDSGSFFYYPTKLTIARRPHININAEELLEALGSTRKALDHDLKLFSHRKHLAIEYENDLLSGRNHRACLNKISDFLSVGNFDGKIKLSTAKSIPSFAQVISNWQKVREKLENTEYSVYL